MAADDPAQSLLALRLDDVGACSKRFEVYSNRSWGRGPFYVSANWLFLKYLPAFRAWGVYREMRPQEWRAVFDLLEKRQARLTVAVTAAWPESETRLTPFPKKFPQEAAALKEGLEAGLIEIANHGLSHCVLAQGTYKPRWFSGNRRFHREFVESISEEVQDFHLRRSQEILQDFFQTEVLTLVPPGNVFTPATVRIARQYGLRFISCNTETRLEQGMIIIGDEKTLAFHDRDLVLGGLAWLEAALAQNSARRLCWVKDLGQAISETAA